MVSKQIIHIYVRKDAKMNRKDIELMAFTLMLKKFPVLFSKIRHSKKIQNSALEILKILYEDTFGRETTCSELMTKIDEMTRRVKKKSKMSGDIDKINLKTWEKIILNLMNGDNHPTKIKMPGKLLRETENEFEENKPKKIKLNHPLEAFETNETKVLSNEELKRYVLLQQLRVLKMKEKKFNATP